MKDDKFKFRPYQQMMVELNEEIQKLQKRLASERGMHLTEGHLESLAKKLVNNPFSKAVDLVLKELTIHQGTG